jgi:hypothetical protein
MNSEKGEANQLQLLLEQYKLYVELADRVSARRAEANKFYISLLTGLLILFSLIIKIDDVSIIVNFLIIIGSIFGVILCFIWFLNIRSYRQLNSGKFRVIQKMEERLPFSCFKCEWDILGNGKKSNDYITLTRVEQYIPISFAVLYLIIIFYIIIYPIDVSNVQDSAKNITNISIFFIE